MFVSASQSAGSAADMASDTPDVVCRVSVSQLGKPLTLCVKAAISALMQVEYAPTVAVQVMGQPPHPLFMAQGTVLWQSVSCPLQFCRSFSSVGELLEAA
jgi:hypothetical protein